MYLLQEVENHWILSRVLLCLRTIIPTMGRMNYKELILEAGS